MRFSLFPSVLAVSVVASQLCFPGNVSADGTSSVNDAAVTADSSILESYAYSWWSHVEDLKLADIARGVRHPASISDIRTGTSNPSYTAPVCVAGCSTPAVSVTPVPTSTPESFLTSEVDVEDLLTTSFTWGYQTSQALTDKLKEMQAYLGVTVDGVYGPKTAQAHKDGLANLSLSSSFALEAPAPAPTPAPEPSPTPTTMPSTVSNELISGNPFAALPNPHQTPTNTLPCEKYSRFANTWVAETVRISWTDEQKDQFCDRLKVVSLYETLWTDFFGMTAQQMFPENTAPNIVYRERLGNTIPHMHMDITGEVLRFDMDYVVGYVDETGLLDFPNVTTVTVEYLESRAAQFGYCANNFERGIPLQDYYQSDVPVEGWYWRCDIRLTSDQYPNYGIALYHPNRAVPSWFRVEVVSSNADSSASISVNFRDNSSGWRLN